MRQPPLGRLQAHRGAALGAVGGKQNEVFVLCGGLETAQPRALFVGGWCLGRLSFFELHGHTGVCNGSYARKLLHPDAAAGGWSGPPSYRCPRIQRSPSCGSGRPHRLHRAAPGRWRGREHGQLCWRDSAAKCHRAQAHGLRKGLACITHYQGYNAFHVCILSANDECFDLLLPLVSDVNVRSACGIHADFAATVKDRAPHLFNASPLHYACQWGQHRMAKALLKRGADRMARDSHQRTPLMFAGRGGHLTCAVLILGQSGKLKLTPAEVNAVDESGATALHFAARRGFEKICGVLIEAGARLDLSESRGFTPLMIAQHFNPTNAALLALLSGAGLSSPPGTVCDRCGKTAAQASVNNLKACSQCQAVRYCGAECSVAAWQEHKAACKARKKEREEATNPKFVDLPS